jgi:hypothetical protein
VQVAMKNFMAVQGKDQCEQSVNDWGGILMVRKDKT